MLSHEVRILFSKEWRQLLRSRAAVATSFLLPILLLLVIPAIQFAAATAARGKPASGSVPSYLPGLADFGNDPLKMLPLLVLPLLVSVTGLTLPSVAGSYTLIAERESRTIELLVALPVRIGEILLAKLLAILLLAGLITVPLLAIDAVLLLATGTGTIAFALSLFVVLAGALAYSTSSALLVSLLARDYRAAQNVIGALLAPSILVTSLFVLFVPGGALKLAGLGLVFAGAAAAVAAVAVRVVTFERLLR